MADNNHALIPDTKVVNSVTEELRHYHRGFERGDVNTAPYKNEIGNYEWSYRYNLNPVDSVYTTNTTTIAAGTYIYDVGFNDYAITNIAWQINNTVRYTLTISANDLVGWEVGDYFRCKNATNADNNGRFQITAVNTASLYVEISNTLITNNTKDELSPPATCVGDFGYSELNGIFDGDWVSYDTTNSVWRYIEPLEGAFCYNKALDVDYYFDGSNWVKKCGGLLLKEVTISANEVLMLNQIPINILTGISGATISLVNAVATLDYGTTTYTTGSTGIALQNNVDRTTIASFSDSFVKSTFDAAESSNNHSTSLVGQGIIATNTGLIYEGGDSPIKISVLYVIIYI